MMFNILDKFLKVNPSNQIIRHILRRQKILTAVIFQLNSPTTQAVLLVVMATTQSSNTSFVARRNINFKKIKNIKSEILLNWIRISEILPSILHDHVFTLEIQILYWANYVYCHLVISLNLNFKMCKFESNLLEFPFERWEWSEKNTSTHQQKSVWCGMAMPKCHLPTTFGFYNAIRGRRSNSLTQLI